MRVTGRDKTTHLHVAGMARAKISFQATARLSNVSDGRHV